MSFTEFFFSFHIFLISFLGDQFKRERNGTKFGHPILPLSNLKKEAILFQIKMCFLKRQSIIKRKPSNYILLM